MRMTPARFVFPGDWIPSEDLPIPSNPSKPLKLGPGLHHNAPSTISTVLAGSLSIDAKKNAIWVENNTGRVLIGLNLPISYQLTLFHKKPLNYS